MDLTVIVVMRVSACQYPDLSFIPLDLAGIYFTTFDSDDCSGTGDVFDFGTYLSCSGRENLDDGRHKF
jgi:hypothetical protein